MASPRWISPLELAALAWPAAVRPEELGPPRILAVTKTGGGTGTLAVSGCSFDDHSVRIEIVTGGEPGVATYRAWTDGATWGDTLPTSTEYQALLHTAAHEITGGVDTGLRISFAAGTPTSFVTGARWDFFSRRLQVAQAACLAATSEAYGLIAGKDGGGQFTGDLNVEDPSLKGWVAAIARMAILEKRGLDPGTNDGAYLRALERANAKLTEVGQKLRHPQGVTESETRYAPEVLLGADRGGISSAHRGLLSSTYGGRCGRC